MNQRIIVASLLDAVPGIPVASANRIVAQAYAAWQAHRDDSAMNTAAVRAAVDVGWRPGYHAGARDGHHFATSYLAETVLKAAEVSDEARNLLRHTLHAAYDVASSKPTVCDPGPSRVDYSAAIGHWSLRPDAQRLSDALRLAYTSGYRSGHGDATWSAAAQVLAVVERAIPIAAQRETRVDGRSGYDWLRAADIDVRWAAEEHRRRHLGRGGGSQPVARPVPGTVTGHRHALSPPSTVRSSAAVPRWKPPR